MTIGDAQNGKAIRAAGLGFAFKSRMKSGGRRAVGCRFVIGGLVAITMTFTAAQAQQQNPPPAQPVQPGQTQAPAQPPTPAPTPAPAATADESAGKTSGNYLIQQSVEFGGRDSFINGNLNNYDTFENLQSGMRLFDYSLNMHSLNNRGIFFDDLSFTNFGYGGDPNEVSRLRVTKNKWYDFRVMFRQDKNFWDYNLLANPLNPSSFSVPTPIVNSPQALDLSRHMQDYDLILFPQSRLRFRLGYSRNSNQGPASGTVEGGTEPLLSQILLYRTSSYRMGVDYKGLSKTTLSFDELLDIFENR